LKVCCVSKPPAAKKAKPPASTGKKQVPEQIKPYLFQKGQSGNPKGRTPGARNKLGEQFLQDLLAEWEVNGRKTIQAAMADDPAAVLRVIASTLPKELSIEKKPGEDLSDEELVAIVDRMRSQLASVPSGASAAGAPAAGSTKH
jgi:Family of unknown function (DUF5681)